MNVIITGGNGFIGSHLTEELLKKGNNVTVMIKPDSNLVNIKQLIKEKEEDNIITKTDKLTIINCDLQDLDKIEEIITRIKPDIIYHLGAQPFVKPSWDDPISTFKINILGTTKIFETIKKIGLKTKVLLACSSAEYGTTTNEKQPLNEKDPLMAIHPYGISKLATELIGRQYYINFKIDTINLRFFNQTGKRKINDACSDFARTIAKIQLGLKEPLIEVGNLESYRDITGIKDTIQAIILASEKGIPGETYNVCSGIKTKIRDVLEYLITLSDKKITIKENIKDKLRRTDEDVILGDNTKIKGLGYKPTQTIKELLKEMYEYWLDYYQRKQAIILAGGLGTRLKEITKDKPKPMTEFKNKPFLDYQIEQLEKYFNEIIICAGYKAEIIKNYYNKNDKIIFSTEKEPLGTGGAIKNAEQLIEPDKPFILLNGDTYTELNYKELFKKHKESELKHTMVITKTTNPSEVGIVTINEKGIITGFKEKPKNPLPTDKYMNAGVYILNPEFLKKIPKRQISLEKEIFPELIKEGIGTQLYKEGYYIDIGTIDNYNKFKEFTEGAQQTK